MKYTGIEDLIEELKKRSVIALGRSITILENEMDGWEQLMDYACRTAREDRLIMGITGAGGAGKSTLISKIIAALRKRGKTVGVMAIDPSSPYTGGAVLGDRIRMGNHAQDTGVFIRSFASKGYLGGISEGVKKALYLYKSFGFDVIIIETVGVGQQETDITCFVDVTTVILAPGNGDCIQLAKAGTQEIADVFAVNKADKPEAELLYQQMLSNCALVAPEKRPRIIKTSATAEEGIEELVDAMEMAKERLADVLDKKRRLRIENEIYHGAMHIMENKLEDEIRKLTSQVIEGQMTPIEAAVCLGNTIKI